MLHSIKKIQVSNEISRPGSGKKTILQLPVLRNDIEKCNYESIGSSYLLIRMGIDI
jgi:hypothetical protein